jgi:hypothetical protein
MEDPNKIITEIYEHSTEYARLQAKSAKLEIYERLTNLISSGVTLSFVILFTVFSFLFINFGLAYWLSEMLHSRTIGFTIVGVFYFAVSGLYLLFRRTVARNRVRDAVLLKVSKTMDDYEKMMEEQDRVHAEIDISEEKIKSYFQDLKESFQSEVPAEESADAKDERTNMSRVAVTSVIEYLFKKVFFKKGGVVKQDVLPLVANTVVTSMLFKESKGKSLFENLKLKLKKMFS